jgi:16S rRNA (adenine1518-N6/adenine1519-N6)-dimethyltransferase
MSDIQAKIYALPTIRETIEKFFITTKKSLGQNFIFDLNITSKIVRIAGVLENKFIIEIGSGAGSLTRPILLANPAKLLILEKDTAVIPVVEELQNIAGKQLEVINTDALKVDYKATIQQHGFSKASIIANLPYNVATELLFKWLHTPEYFETLTLMFQKEVAERIVAKPSTKDYGWLAIFSQMLFECSIEYILPPTAFIPPPKVDSAVVLMTARAKPLYDVDLKILEKLCKTAFAQRRKTIRNNLKNFIPNVDEVFEQVGLSPLTRPEDIPIKTYCDIVKLINIAA